VDQPAGAELQRWRLLVAYDGAPFHGFAIQSQVPTVAGALRQALERTARLREPPSVTCAGRTDAGVHARGQVVHVDLPPIPYDGAGLARALNRQLAPEVVVLHAEAIGPDFDARRSATGRTYRYLVWNAPGPDPLLAPVAWHVPGPLDLGSMRTASDVLLGSHDFRSFCRRRPGTPTSEPIVRRVTRAQWSVDQGPEATDAGAGTRATTGGTGAALGTTGVALGTGSGWGSGAEFAGGGRLLRFEIAAGSFCHQMVRSVVATLVEVGRGRQNAAGVMEWLRATTRHRMPDPAPAHGLCLVSVDYGPPGLRLTPSAEHPR
jgi:tRNA pseudouridine38-40 synthase